MSNFEDLHFTFESFAGSSLDKTALRFRLDSFSEKTAIHDSNRDMEIFHDSNNELLSFKFSRFEFLNPEIFSTESKC